MGGAGSRNGFSEIGHLLTNCSSAASNAAAGAGCSAVKNVLDGQGQNFDSCLACSSNCEGHTFGHGCNLSEEHIMRYPGHAMDYAGYFDASRTHAQKPLYESGSLVRIRYGEANRKKSEALTDIYSIDARPLGRGSYGEVWAATHRKSGLRRAVKSVEKAGLRRYVSNVSGFIRREIDILRRLDHPNIVRLYEAFEDEEQTDLVLELCEGGDLLERLSLTKPRLPEREAAVLFTQMLGAVQHLYLRGVVHRDLKPENFLFSRREPEREPLPPEVAPVKLIDFGLSRRLSSETYIHMTPKIGTTEYMAPEAYAGKLDVSLAHRADMWSLGVVLHVIFLGHFPSPKLVELSPHIYFSNPCFKQVSPEGIDLLSSLLRCDPVRRPAVNMAIQHPWLTAASRVDDSRLVRAVPLALQHWRSSPRLRRLALAAAAREVDDRDVSMVRRLFFALELECEGALTRSSLERAAMKTSPVAAAAAELSREFDLVDVDGSDALDWTEIVALTIGAQGNANQSPKLRDEWCWGAFDLLSQGSGVVSAVALGQLLAPNEVGPWLVRGSGLGSLGSLGSLGGYTPGGEVQRIAELDRMVREVEPSGALNGAHFTNLIKQLDSNSSPGKESPPRDRDSTTFREL